MPVAIPATVVVAVALLSPGSVSVWPPCGVAVAVLLMVPAVFAVPLTVRVTKFSTAAVIVTSTPMLLPVPPLPHAAWPVEAQVQLTPVRADGTSSATRDR